MTRISTLAALCALSLPVAAQQTWIVDDDGPGDFAEIQLAIDAAGNGDTILVRNGGYGGFVIDGKGLVIQGEGVAAVSVFGLFGPATPSIVIRNLGASQDVQIRGLDTLPLGVSELENIVLAQCAGAVLFEDCDFSQSGGESIVMKDCASATFVSCLLFAAPTFVSTSNGIFLAHVYYDGIRAESSNLFLYDCEVRGSDGANSAGIFGEAKRPPGPAGAGVVLVNSTMLASGCTILGGSGGDDDAAGCDPGPNGRPGVELGGNVLVGFSTLRLLDTTITGGTGGLGGCGLPNGVDAPAILATPGNSVIQHAGTARTFFPASPVPASGLLNLTFQGEPGDLAFIYLSLGLQPGQQLVPLALALHVDLPVTVLTIGTLPASGDLALDLPVPPLPGYQVYVGQAVFIAQNGGLFESGPRTVLVTP